MAGGGVSELVVKARTAWSEEGALSLWRGRASVAGGDSSEPVTLLGPSGRWWELYRGGKEGTVWLVAQSLTW